MHKKLLFKAVALAVCCSVLLLAFPASAVAKKSPKSDTKVFMKAGKMITVILPTLDPIFEHDKNITQVKKKDAKPPKVGDSLRADKRSDQD